MKNLLNYNKISANNNSTFFIVSTIFLIPVLFFKKTLTLYYISIIVYLIYIIMNLSCLKKIFTENRFFSFVLLIFFISIFISTIYSPKIDTSLNVFITSYLFHLIILIAFSIYFSRGSPKIEILAVFVILFNYLFVIYLLSYSLKYCNLNIMCFLNLGLGLQSHVDESKIYIHGLLNLASTLCFIFFITLLIFLRSTSNKAKFSILILSIVNLLTLFWLGRRAALLGILISMLFTFLLFTETRRRKFRLVFLLFTTVSLPVFLSPSLKEKVLIRAENLEILSDMKCDEFHKSGSLGLRLHEWCKSIDRLIESPLIGTGLGRKISKSTFFQSSPIGHPHNTFISIAIQSGIHTMVLFIILNFFLLIKAYFMYKKFNFIENLHNVNLFTHIIIVSFMYLIAFFVIANFAGLEEKVGILPFWITSGILIGIFTNISSQNITFRDSLC